MTRDDIAALLRRRLDALRRHDAAALSALYSDSCTLESPMAGNASGRDAVAKVYEAFLAAFPDAEFHDADAIIDGARAAVVATVTGTQRGVLMGLPPSGKPFTLTVVHLLTLRDGFIVSEQRVYDFTGLLVQLGLLKAKPA